MDVQTEYLINKNYVGRSQVRRNLSILLAIMAISYIAIWYSEPDNAYINLPHCLRDIVFRDSQKDMQTIFIEGMYVAHSDCKIEGADIKPFWPNDTYLLRFDSSGQVMYAEQKDYGHLNWRKVIMWFDWDSTDETIMHGEYKIEGKLITFTTTNMGVYRRSIHWNGRIAMDDATQRPTLFLTGLFANTLIYKYYTAGQCPFVIQK